MDLVFDNAEMIKLMTERGEAIKYSESGKIF